MVLDVNLEKRTCRGVVVNSKIEVDRNRVFFDDFGIFRMRGSNAISFNERLSKFLEISPNDGCVNSGCRGPNSGC